MGCIWLYDLLVKHASLERTGHHTIFARVLFAMPFLYPLCSLALGRSFPEITSPVMPCSVAVFTIGVMLAFSERINIVLAMFLCHWALIGLSKVYFFGIPEDYLMACSIVPALYLFFREYIQAHENSSTSSRRSDRRTGRQAPSCDCRAERHRCAGPENGRPRRTATGREPLIHAALRSKIIP